MKTNVFVNAPPGTLIYNVAVDGRKVGFVAAGSGGEREVAGVSVMLAPGQTAHITFSLLGPKNAATAMTLERTPLASDVPVALDQSMDCPVISSNPTSGAQALGRSPESVTRR